MSLTSQIAELDRLIDDNSKHVELNKALQRLMSNRDFKKLIIDGYFNAEAIRLVHAKADAKSQTPDAQAKILSQMDAIGNLAYYFDTIRMQGETATKVVEDAIIDRNDLLTGA